ncbi:neogenin-like [Oscarella lobularis]|uniref:neogenin-like n=1 Tax=Oscarella lobularis TaxID=121494 RepID=UPI0033135544
MLAVPLLLAFVLVPVAADNDVTLNLFNRSSTPGDFFDFVPIGYNGVLPGTTVVFVCNTSRTGPFMFDWYFRPVGSMDGIAGEQLIRSSLNPGTNLTNGGSTLTIRSFSSQYTQEYQCIASNVGGVEGDTKWVAVRSAVVPDPPKIVLPDTIRRDFNITLAWTGPMFTGYQPVTSYDIFYQTNHPDSPWNQTVLGGSGFNKVIITPLFPNTDYVFRVRAVNVVGPGNFSQPEQIKTQLAPIDNPPTNFAITVQNATSTSVKFNLSFTPAMSPCLSPCYEEIIGYNLTDVANTITPVSVASGADTVTLTGLKGLTTYELVVYALNAGPYVSPPSNVQTIRTTARAPSQPTNVRALTSETTATSIAFAWDPPLDNGGINVATYKIQYKKDSEVDFIDFGSRSGLDATISNLNSSTRYYVEVKANNTYAVGPAGSTFVTTKSQQSTVTGRPRTSSPTQPITPSDSGSMVLCSTLVLLVLVSLPFFAAH